MGDKFVKESNRPTIRLTFHVPERTNILVAKAELNICASFAKIKFRLTGVDNGDKATAVLVAEVDDTADFACDVEQNYQVLRDHIEHTTRKGIKKKETKSTKPYFRNALEELRRYLRKNRIEITYFNGETFVVPELIRSRPKHSTGPFRCQVTALPLAINFRNGTVDLYIIETGYTPMINKSVTAKFPDEIRDIIDERALKNRSEFSVNATLLNLDNGNKSEVYACENHTLIKVIDSITREIESLY